MSSTSHHIKLVNKMNDDNNHDDARVVRILAVSPLRRM